MDGFRLRAQARRMKKWAKKYVERMNDVEKAKKAARASAFKNAYTFVEALQAKGYEPLGSGAFGQVLGYPGSDKVIKVLYRPQRDGWLDYVKWAADKGFNGRYAPKVYSYKLVKAREPKMSWGGVSEHFGIAVMERLDKTLCDTPEAHDAKAVNALFNVAMHDNPLANKILDQLDPGLAKFGAALQKQFPKNIDVHDGNFMLRKNGEFVVTDPVASYESKVYTQRFKTADFKLAA